jgi:hypothetical protein
MKIRVWGMILLAGVLAIGCRKKQDETGSIRAGILKHLASVNTLNISAMDMDIKSVNVQGNQATAMVEFRPKSGAPEGAGMQVSYSLEKQNGEWVVVKKEAAGGEINHPSTNANPHTQTTPQGTTQDMPNFQDLLHPANPGANPSLPPGHPPVSPGSTPGSGSTGTRSKTKQP